MTLGILRDKAKNVLDFVIFLGSNNEYISLGSMTF